MSQNKTDEELMRLLQLGDEFSFQELFERHQGKVFARALRFVKEKDKAEDMVQETFLKLLRFQDRYSESQPFLPWLYVLTQNVCIDFLRKERKYRSDQTLEGMEDRIATDQELSTNEFDSQIKDLSPEAQEIFRLRLEKDYDFEKIAQSLGGTAAWARQIFHRGLKKLREKL